MRAPKGLGKAGRELWHAFDDYELDPRERRLLLDAAREADLIAELDSALDGQELIVKGSQGQPAPHPMIPELRQHRNTVKLLLAGIHLPDTDGSAALGREWRARNAARTRWSGPPSAKGA